MYFRTIFFLTLFLVCACENAQFGNREKGALGGGAIGAGLGAIIGNQVGNPGAGVAIGAAFGALSGALIGNAQDAAQADADQQKEVMQRQEEELRRQKREIEDLKRQEYYNEALRPYDRKGGAASDDSFSY